MPIGDVIEQAVNKAIRDGLIFPMIVVLVSRQAQVWAMEIKNGPDGLERDELCDNLRGEGIMMPIIAYVSDRNGKTCQAEILPDTGGAQA
jgi:hypothetical protein